MEAAGQSRTATRSRSSQRAHSEVSYFPRYLLSSSSARTRSRPRRTPGGRWDARHSRLCCSCKSRCLSGPAAPVPACSARIWVPGPRLGLVRIDRARRSHAGLALARAGPSGLIGRTAHGFGRPGRIRVLGGEHVAGSADRRADGREAVPQQEDAALRRLPQAQEPLRHPDRGRSLRRVPVSAPLPRRSHAGRPADFLHAQTNWSRLHVSSPAARTAEEGVSHSLPLVRFCSRRRLSAAVRRAFLPNLSDRPRLANDGRGHGYVARAEANRGGDGGIGPEAHFSQRLARRTRLARP